MKGMRGDMKEYVFMMPDGELTYGIPICFFMGRQIAADSHNIFVTITQPDGWIMYSREFDSFWYVNMHAGKVFECLGEL